jgi:hypothetical protein
MAARTDGVVFHAGLRNISRDGSRREREQRHNCADDRDHCMTPHYVLPTRVSHVDDPARFARIIRDRFAWLGM